MWTKKQLLSVLFVFCLVFCLAGTCSAEEMYTISNNELTRLETNLTKLSLINKTQLSELKKLKVDLNESQQALVTSKIELQQAQQSLKIAKQSLKQLEKEVQNKPKRTLGIGQGNNGMSFLGGYNIHDYAGVWIYADKQSKSVGMKFNF